MSDNNHSIVCHNNEDSASGGSGSSASLNNDSETSNSSSSSEDTSNAKKRKLFEKSEKLHLTLENFDSDDIPSDYPYVLTSPRSLAACKHFAVRPVDLLPFRIEDARRQLEIEGDFSFEALTLLREAEEERREILDRCRQLRDEWIKEDEERFREDNFLDDGSQKGDEPDEGDDDEEEEGLPGDDDDEEESPDDVFETRSEAEERRRKDNLLTQPLLKLSDGVKNLLDNRSVTSSSGRNCSSPYTSSDRPEADQSCEEESNNEVSEDEVEFHCSANSSDSESVSTENSSSSYDRDCLTESEQRRKTFSLKKSAHYSDLTRLNRESNSEPSSRNSSRDRDSDKPSVHFCDQPTLVVLDNLGRRHSRVSGYSDRVFRNPYGPPLYVHSRPAIMNPISTTSNNNVNNLNNNNNNLSQTKRKARRIRRLQPTNFNVSPDLMTSQIIDVDEIPESERPTSSCCQRRREICGSNFRWKKRSSSSFRPSERTSKLLESVKSENSSKSSTIRLASGEVDLETLDLPNHDRRILERLQLKRERERAAEELAHVQQLIWKEENEHNERERALFELNWKRKVEQKRAQESLFNEQRLLEARKLFLESQDLLRRLIKEKDERARQFVHDAQRRKAENCAEWRANEESRRLVVENALEELLARDTQYRKELNSHIESRIRQAELRRLSHQEKRRENLLALNEFYQDRHRKRLSIVERNRIEHILSVRKEIEERLAKVSNITKEERLRWKDKTLHQLRMERALKSEKARKLKSELDDALDRWRKQVLEVQSKSIRAAEERAQLVLSQRKLRIASEVRERRQRHEEARQKVRQIDESLESQKLKNLVEKKSKIEKWSEERNLAMEKSRQLAQKTAELRQAIKNQTSPDTFDKRVARVNIEAKVTQLQEYYV